MVVVVDGAVDCAALVVVVAVTGAFGLEGFVVVMAVVAFAAFVVVVGVAFAALFGVAPPSFTGEPFLSGDAGLALGGVLADFRTGGEVGMFRAASAAFQVGLAFRNSEYRINLRMGCCNNQPPLRSLYWVSNCLEWASSTSMLVFKSTRTFS